MRIALIACLGLLPGAALAQPSDCAGWTDLAPTAEISLARVKRGVKAFFIKSASQHASCPAASASCARKGFVLAGDLVIVSGHDQGFACAEFVNAKGLVTTGWLQAGALQALPELTGGQSWSGNWRGNPEQSILITAGAAGGTLVLHGDATFGALDPDRVRRGGVNFGNFEAIARAEGNMIAFAMGMDGQTLAYDAGDDYACRLRLHRLGPFLLAKDNGMCGGNNVSFTGDYRRN